VKVLGKFFFEGDEEDEGLGSGKEFVEVGFGSDVPDAREELEEGVGLKAELVDVEAQVHACEVLQVPKEHIVGDQG